MRKIQKKLSRNLYRNRKTSELFVAGNKTEVYQVSGDWSRDIDETLDFNWASYRAETGTNPTVFTYM